MGKITIVIVDDHEVVRHGLRLALDAEADMTIVGEAATGEEAVALAQRHQPEVMLLDVRLGDADGPDICTRVLVASPKTSVVMLTNYLQDGLVFRSLTAGAKGYIIKDVELTELKKMIRTVYRGRSVLDPKVTGQVISTVTGANRTPTASDMAAHMARLADTDIAIIRALSEGMTNKQIGVRVHLSPHTIKDRLEKICDVLSVRSRTEVVAEAIRRGLI
jgi:DNA-binding NarL/FixJ family response regulator